MNINDQCIVIEKNNQKIECNILFTFTCNETMKSYIGYTDNIVAKNGRKNIYISSFNPFSNDWKLEDINTEKEYQMIGEVLEYLDNQYTI